MTTEIKSPYAIISEETILKHIDKLYEPYKVYGRIDDIITEDVPVYIYGINEIGGTVKSYKITDTENETGYVIFCPKSGETEKLKAFNEISRIEQDLLELRQLQIKFNTYSLNDIFTEDEGAELMRLYDKYIRAEEESNNDESIEEESGSDESTSLQKAIEHYLWFMLKSDNRQGMKILHDSDYAKLISWVNFYFEKEFTIPDIDSPIRRVNTSKGSVVWAFKDLFTELHPTKPHPDSLYELIKHCFHQYREDKVINLRKTNKSDFYKKIMENR